MSSSPTVSGDRQPSAKRVGFKALSRMSSSPTILGRGTRTGRARRFQSAVAHELFSDLSKEAQEEYGITLFQSAVAHELFSDRSRCWVPGHLKSCFKALSRMSSSPTILKLSVIPESFSSFKALSRMSSSPTAAGRRSQPQLPHGFKALSRMSSSPTRRRRAPGRSDVYVSKRCRA